VPGALVVDREKIAQDFDPESADRRPEVTGPEQKSVVFCGSVDGSRPVAEKLKVLGYSDAVHVDGGFLALRDAGVATTAPTVDTEAAQTSTDSAVSAR
jgi:rhodanese-related sulfurtransferase